MEEYLSIFIEDEIPKFLFKYFETKTMKRLMSVSQFCGCDYTKIYSPLFFYSRFDHSLIVSLMVWHFTHEKNETIKALLHDAGTPVFAHAIDYMLEDYQNQESSEKKLSQIISEDEKLISLLKSDGIDILELDDLSNCYILENKSPRLCADRLDGVLHTAYIWLHTHDLRKIKRIYDDIIVLKNEEGNVELGFKSEDICLEFLDCVKVYAQELQSNKDKYTLQFVAEVTRNAAIKKLITTDDLYNKNEDEIVKLFCEYFDSWKIFNKCEELISTDSIPANNFYISIDVKKRNTIPLININGLSTRIIDVNDDAKKIYDDINNYKDKLYAYVKEIKNINNEDYLEFILNKYKEYLINYYYYPCDQGEEKLLIRKEIVERMGNEYLLKIIKNTLLYKEYINTLLKEDSSQYNDKVFITITYSGEEKILSTNCTGGYFPDKLYEIEFNNEIIYISKYLLKYFIPNLSIEEENDVEIVIDGDIGCEYYHYSLCFSMPKEKNKKLKLEVM